MAVSSPWNARRTLRELIRDDPVAIRDVLRDPYLPPGMSAVADQPRTMSEHALVGGYGNDERYDFPDDIADVIASTPGRVLAEPSVSREHKEAFLTTSLDLTMEGGTTSGVVYPLAVCELATSFRFRNVGGASAGAIAAALTAAAELGRIRRTGGDESPPPAAPDPPGTPRVRQGFAGLADLMVWLTQSDSDTDSADEFRLAQLFRPGPATHNAFRLAIATMRGRTWPLPLLALFALGRVTRLVAIALILLTIVVTGWVGARFAGQIRPWWQTIGWGLLETTAFVVGAVGIVNLLQGLSSVARSRKEVRADRAAAGTPLGGLRTVTSGDPIGPTTFLPAVVSGLVLIGIAVLDAVLRPWQFLGACFVGLTGAFVVTIWLVIGVLAIVNGFGRHSYGLIGGTAARRKRDLLDRLAAAPPPTVTPSLVPWLSGCLTQLAGLPDGEILRFGHLWHGSAYVPPTPAADAEAGASREAPSSDRRLVNLELMTTDLTRRRPYKFPLTPSDDPDDELWLRVDQLDEAGIFPPAVLTALASTDAVSGQDRDGTSHTYHRLPRPADLPVIFAVRVSMALPALFQAVPMHRFVADTPVRDDLGRQILIGSTPLTAFTVDRPWSDGRPPAPPPFQAEELWFSDGGITSNFPVHFFDAPLPGWPTVSLNLGNYPRANPIQDVWLPQDWDPSPTPTEPLRRSGLVLPGAILETAMSWRDSMQSAMPGYRNRIAQVRSRPNEGGTNLFMTTETIASMALRGVVAGARLRARYSDRPQWDRFRWLRLRVALSNLEQLRGSTAARRETYDRPLADRRWLDRLSAEFAIPAPLSGSDPTTPPATLIPPLIPPLTAEQSAALIPPVAVIPPVTVIPVAPMPAREPLAPPPPASPAPAAGDTDGIPWYDPDDRFWPAAAEFLEVFAAAYRPHGPGALTTNPPLPEPKFRQVPQE